MTVIGNMICRCIEDARRIPYILTQEQVIEILVENPMHFAELVRDEHYDGTMFSDERLTAKLDATAELGQLEALDGFDLSFAGRIAEGADLDAVLNLVNQLTRTFTVYTGNAITIFEKEFQLFMEKLRQSLLQSGMVLKTTDLTDEDIAGLESKAGTYLHAGQFLQAFLFDHMLHAQVITRELVILPPSARTFTLQFMRSALRDTSLRPSLLRFILRVCYVSQGAWTELFDKLVQLADAEPDLCPKIMLVDKIEQDGIFCCNLLCESFETLIQWSPAERRTAIENRIESGKHQSRAS